MNTLETLYRDFAMYPDELAGHRIRPPYRLDITDPIAPGADDITVIASNLLANRMSWDVWGDTRGTGSVLDSGMMGPVEPHMERDIGCEHERIRTNTPASSQ